MKRKILIAGGGIGGLAAALSCSRVASEIELFERFTRFSEVGAGIQLGPNVVKILYRWGLKDAINLVAAFPERLRIRNAVTGAQLGQLRLGGFAVRRYGAPYATIHRADLHGVLLSALRHHSNVTLNTDSEINGFQQDEHGVRVVLTDGREAQGDALVGADGLWSNIRRQLLNDGGLHATGHLAYRAQLPQSNLPERLRSQEVTAWLGPRMHVVQYPVRRGEWMNVVAIVHGHMPGDAEYWDHTGNAARLRRAVGKTAAPLQDMIHAISYWRLWALSDRAPMRSAREHGVGRVALLGDAAHPMLPYLAQGAGMAIEDADELGRSLGQSKLEVPAALREYGEHRWRRNARVQTESRRNGRIFHATGIVRVGRDMAIKVLGERLLDKPWLYRGASRQS